MNYPTRRRFSYTLAAVTLAAGAAALPVGAHAQQFPSKPIRMIVPWPAGGSTDILARALGNEMSKQIGQPVIIDNKGGAAGKIGTTFAAKSPADGYTIYLGTIANFGVAAAYELSLQYDPVKDFAPVAYVADSPAMLVVRSSLPVHNLKELREYAQNSGKQMSYASAGEGSGYHLMGELFKIRTKLNLLHVPFQAAPQAAAAVSGDFVDMTFGAGGLKPYIESGKMRPIAVTGKDRWAFLPDVATFDSQGVHDIAGNSWFAIFVPSGTPQDLIFKLNGAINKAIVAPEFQEFLKVNGFVAAGGRPAALAAVVAKDMTVWKNVVQTANLRPGK